MSAHEIIIRVIVEGASTSAAPVADQIARKRKNPPLPRSFYIAVDNLAVGGILDITDAAKAAGLSASKIKRRIDAWVWWKNKGDGGSRAFMVAESTGAIKCARIH